MGRRTRRGIPHRSATVTVRLTEVERDALDEFTELGDFDGLSDAGRTLMLPYLEAMVAVREGKSSFGAAVEAARSMARLNQYLAEDETEHKRQRKEKEQGELGLGLSPA